MLARRARFGHVATGGLWTPQVATSVLLHVCRGGSGGHRVLSVRVLGRMTLPISDRALEVPADFERVSPPPVERAPASRGRKGPRFRVPGAAEPRKIEPDAPPPPSEEAYRGFARGDEAHIPEVFNYWYGRLVCFIERSYSISVDDAKDIAQNVFLKALRLGPKVRDDVSIPARLFTIARSEALEYVKKVRRRNVLFELHKAVSPAAEVQAPDELTHRKMVFEEILDMIRIFPEREYQAFVLRRVEGWSYAEIGVLLEMSEAKAKQVVHQTWKELQRRLGVELAP